LPLSTIQTFDPATEMPVGVFKPLAVHEPNSTSEAL